jgi:hypothetical protein
MSAVLQEVKDWLKLLLHPDTSKAQIKGLLFTAGPKQLQALKEIVYNALYNSNLPISEPLKKKFRGNKWKIFINPRRKIKYHHIRVILKDLILLLYLLRSVILSILKT